MTLGKKLFYKSEGFRLFYNEFPETRKNVHELFSEKIKVPMNEKWLRKVYRVAWKLLNPSGYEENEEYIYINRYTQIYSLLLRQLWKFGLSPMRIHQYCKQIQEMRREFECFPYLFAFYIANAMSGNQVNFYFSEGNVALLLETEYISLVSLSWNNSILIVNLNNLLSELFWKDFSVKGNIVLSHDKKEIELFCQLYCGVYEKEEIRIKLKRQSIQELEIFWKEKDLSKYTLIADHIPHWEIGKKMYRWKAQYVKIKEVVDFK